MPSEQELIDSEDDLIEEMTRPRPEVESAVAQLDDDILILGVAGKMGPTLAELLVRAGARRVIGVSRFSDSSVERYLERTGVETIRADLLDEEALSSLPRSRYVYFLAGFKFGATGNETETWAVNAYLPARVVDRYRDSKIVYLSSGNVYELAPVDAAGSPEDAALGPVGEYAQSRLGGERLATHTAHRTGAALFIARLFYATELRYGIIHDIGLKVKHREPIDLETGHVNQIWQGDASAYLARSFELCANPPTILNVTGRQVLSVREIAIQIGEILGEEPIFTGTESHAALLGDASQLFERLGPPPTPVDDIIRRVAHWIEIGGRSLHKSTKYESRTGAF